ncbi:MAG: hypothetical protein AAGD14_19325 [Planctomycetota bacterium]
MRSGLPQGDPRRLHRGHEPRLPQGGGLDARLQLIERWYASPMGKRVLFAVVLACSTASADDYVRRLTRELMWDSSHEQATEKLRQLGAERCFRTVLREIPKLEPDGPRRAADLLAQWVRENPPLFQRHAKTLVGFAGEEDHVFRGSFIPLLDRCGPKQLGALNQLLGSRYEDTRNAAAAAMARQGAAAHVRIERSLASRSAARRAGACRALQLLDTPPAAFVDRARVLLKDRDPLVRMEAVSAIAIADRDRGRAANDVSRLLDDADSQVWGAAAQAAGDVADPILPLLLARSPTQSERTIAALAALGPAYHAKLIHAIDDGQPERAAILLRALAPIRIDSLADSVYQPILAYATHQNAALRRAYFDTWSRSGSPLSDPVLKQVEGAMADRDARIRICVYRIASSQARNSPGALVRARIGLEDGQAEVRAHAWFMLHRAKEPVPAKTSFIESVKIAGTVEALALMGRARPFMPAHLSVFRDAASSEDPAVAMVGIRGIGFVLEGVEPVTMNARAKALLVEHRRVRVAVGRTLDWLHQAGRKDGWRAEHPACHVGISSLALLAFAAAGVDESHHRYGAIVARALQALRAGQSKQGCLAPAGRHTATTQHALAQSALAEHQILCPRPASRPALRRAMVWSEQARNPALGWRYRIRTGENDTFVTGLMVMAQVTGRMALGKDAPPSDLKGPVRWFNKMTDPVRIL